MAQKGIISLVGKCWMFRYRVRVVGPDGKVVWKKKAEKLATYSHEYRTETSVRPLANLILAPINAETTRPESSDTLEHFIEHHYVPAAKRELKPSSQRTLKVMFELVKPYLNGIELRDVRTSDIERILHGVADSKPRARTSLANARNFLSGVFRYAIRTDALDKENPVQAAKTPKNGLRPTQKNTHAYSLEEIAAMIDALDEPARTVILTAAWTGLRPGEVRGLRWEDLKGDELVVRRSVWGVHVTDTKTGDTAPVPVVPILKKALDAHRNRSGGEYIFQGVSKKPLNLANLARRVIIPKLKAAGLEWYGWYGFRRGLASNLYRSGVPDMVIQRILRHEDVETTQKHYVKTADPDAVAAMKKLERVFKKTR